MAEFAQDYQNRAAFKEKVKLALVSYGSRWRP
jgi:hypothetical protein